MHEVNNVEFELNWIPRPLSDDFINDVLSMYFLYIEHTSVILPALRDIGRELREPYLLALASYNETVGTDLDYFSNKLNEETDSIVFETMTDYIELNFSWMIVEDVKRIVDKYALTSIFEEDFCGLPQDNGLLHYNVEVW